MAKVLMMHRVLPENQIPARNAYSDFGTLISQEYLEKVLAFLSVKYQFSTITDLTQRVNSGEDTSNIICLTFDDGYEDNYLFALPLLVKYRSSATFYPVVNPCVSQSVLPLDIYYYCVDAMQLTDERQDWIMGEQKRKFYNTEPAAQIEQLKQLFNELPSNDKLNVRYLSIDQIKELAGLGFEIGSHSLSHAIFNQNYMTTDKKTIELTHSKKWLESITGKPVKSFCFPSGRYDASSIQIAKEVGYESLCLVKRLENVSIENEVIPAYERVFVKPDSFDELLVELNLP